MLCTCQKLSFEQFLYNSKVYHLFNIMIIIVKKVHISWDGATNPNTCFHGKIKPAKVGLLLLYYSSTFMLCTFKRTWKQNRKKLFSWQLAKILLLQKICSKNVKYECAREETHHHVSNLVTWFWLGYGWNCKLLGRWQQFWVIGILGLKMGLFRILKYTCH